MYDRFSRIAAELGEQLAISNEGEECSYFKLFEMAECVRPLLRTGNGPALVLLALPGGPRFTAVQLAGLAEGSVVVPIPEQAKPGEIANYLALVQPDLVVVEDAVVFGPLQELLHGPTTILVGRSPLDKGGSHRFLDWSDLLSGEANPVSPAARNLPSDTALIQFTSGSTGMPKGILLSSGNIRSYLASNLGFLGRFTGLQVFCPMPQFHAFGGTVVLEHLLCGASVHLANTYMPGEHLKRMQKHRCSAILAAPTYLRLLLQMNALHPEHTPHLSSVSMGSAAVDQVLVESLQRKFPELEIHIRYGLTETMGPITRLSLGPGEELAAPGYVGRPTGDVELDLLARQSEGDTFGQVRVRGEIVARGQLLERDRWQSLQDSEGYLATGDLGHIDGEGRLFLKGRISTFIKRNGFRIDPLEIESVLRSQRGVTEVAVVGVPDPVAGQQIVACVELARGLQSIAEGEMARVCRENLSVNKVPQRFLFTERMPRTASGKPNRVRLTEQVSAG